MDVVADFFGKWWLFKSIIVRKAKVWVLFEKSIVKLLIIANKCDEKTDSKEARKFNGKGVLSMKGAD